MVYKSENAVKICKCTKKLVKMVKSWGNFTNATKMVKITNMTDFCKYLHIFPDFFTILYKYFIFLLKIFPQ
jgi:hypothetical protein